MRNLDARVNYKCKNPASTGWPVPNQMNADHFYAIGDTHAVCEDYALSGVRGDVGYAIVCDGCSSSEGVDFGARALAYAAKDVVLAHSDLFFTTPPQLLGRIIIGKAALIQNFGIPANALDATLLIAVMRGGAGRICAWGDGMWFVGNGILNINARIEYNTNAPYYLNYLLSASRDKDYQQNPKTFGPRHVIQCTPEGGGINRREDKETAPTEPEVFDFSVHNGTVAAVMSDGITQFRKPDSTLIDPLTLLPQFTGFKTLTGVFVTRRLKAMLTQHAKEQWSHDDDISIAAVANVPVPPKP